MLRLAALLTVACALAAHPTLASPSAASPPDGIYRNTITRQDILKAFPSASEDLVRNERGVFTWRFSHGTLSWRQQPRYTTPSVLFGKGRYTVNAERARRPLVDLRGLPVHRADAGGRRDGRSFGCTRTRPDPGDVVFWNLKALVKIGIDSRRGTPPRPLPPTASRGVAADRVGVDAARFGDRERQQVEANDVDDGMPRRESVDSAAERLERRHGVGARSGRALLTFEHVGARPSSSTAARWPWRSCSVSWALASTHAPSRSFSTASCAVGQSRPAPDDQRRARADTARRLAGAPPRPRPAATRCPRRAARRSPRRRTCSSPCGTTTARSRACRRSTSSASSASGESAGAGDEPHRRRRTPAPPRSSARVPPSCETHSRMSASRRRAAPPRAPARPAPGLRCVERRPAAGVDNRRAVRQPPVGRDTAEPRWLREDRAPRFAGHRHVYTIAAVPVRAFLFDFDGLILDTETASRAGWSGCTASTGRCCRLRSGR